MNREGRNVAGPCRYTGHCLRGVVVALLAMATALFVSVPAFAQGTTGTLRGQVLDPAGAVVANAQVTATNKETAVSTKIVTTSAGTYSFPSLLPGRYSVSVEVSGFKKYVKNDVTVLADQDNVADAQLELGVATETVEVTAGAVQVQTASSSLANQFNSDDVSNLPQAAGTLNGSPLNLAVLAPNVVAQPGGVTGVGGSVGGTRPRENNFTVDGVDDNNLGVTGPNSTVIPDAVAEFALQTNQFTAETGHSSGGQFNLVTKTGRRFGDFCLILGNDLLFFDSPAAMRTPFRQRHFHPLVDLAGNRPTAVAPVPLSSVAFGFLRMSFGLPAGEGGSLAFPGSQRFF